MEEEEEEGEGKVEEEDEEEAGRRRGTWTPRPWASGGGTNGGDGAARAPLGCGLEPAGEEADMRRGGGTTGEGRNSAPPATAGGLLGTRRQHHRDGGLDGGRVLGRGEVVVGMRNDETAARLMTRTVACGGGGIGGRGQGERKGRRGRREGRGRAQRPWHASGLARDDSTHQRKLVRHRLQAGHG